MRDSAQGRPPYRLAFCPRAQASPEAVLRGGGDAVFSPREAAELSALPERRLLDRLAGRLAAKRALRAHFSSEHGWDVEARDLEIFNDEDGRPVLLLPEGAPAPAPSFSIAHASEGGVCAVAAHGRRVGADIETVVPRPAAVIAFVAAAGEDKDAPPSDPAAQARLWTGKEAALKLLGLGLDADARDVRERGGEVAYEGEPGRAWRALGAPRVRVDFERAGNSMIAVAYTGE